MKKFDSDIRFKKPFIELTDQIKKTGEVPLEYTDFDYLPTLRCNMRCKHCRQAEVRENKDWQEMADEMNMEQIKKAWDKIPVKGLIIKINGGEPFVKKEMWGIFEYFKERGAYNIVATNAFVFSRPENIERLRKLGLVEITASFDGLEEHHDAVRRRPGLFKIMINFVKDIARDHKVLLECCLQADNIRDLLEMLKLKKDLGVYKIRFQLPVFTTKKETEEASKLMGEKISYEAQTMPTPRYDFSFEDLMQSYKKMQELDIEFDMHPQFFDVDPKACHERRIRDKWNLLCTYMFRIKIDPNGDVRFCPYIIKSFGNIQKDKLEDIWDSKGYRDFRKRILKNNLLPSCENCPHLRIYSRK